MALISVEQVTDDVELVDPTAALEPLEALGLLAQVGVAVIDVDLGITKAELDAVERHIIKSTNPYPTPKRALGSLYPRFSGYIESLTKMFSVLTVQTDDAIEDFIPGLTVIQAEIRRMELAATGWHLDEDKPVDGLRLITPLKKTGASLEVIANNSMMANEDMWISPVEGATKFNVPYLVGKGILLGFGRTRGMPIKLTDESELRIEHAAHTGIRTSKQMSLLFVIDFALNDGVAFGPLNVEPENVRVHTSRSDVYAQLDELES